MSFSTTNFSIFPLKSSSCVSSHRPFSSLSKTFSRQSIHHGRRILSRAEFDIGTPLVLGAFLDNISLPHGTCTIIRIISKICNEPPPPLQKIVDMKKNIFKTRTLHVRTDSRKSASLSYLTNTCIPTGNFIAFYRKKSNKEQNGKKKFRNEPSVI